MEEVAAQVAFERADGLGQRGLGDVQSLCGAIDATVVDDGEEVLQLPGVHAYCSSISPA
jgi:hypothetical protein